MNRLDDRVAIVTGGGSGIGRGIAVAYASEGARVIVVDISRDGGSGTVDLVTASGGEAVFVEADVSNAADVERMAAEGTALLGPPTILCNNAGLMAVEPRSISALEEEAWQRVIDVNLKSVYLCSRFVLPLMMRAGGGAIVNVASIAGLVGSPNYAYAASKGGVVALTRSLALGYAEHDVRVNVICPGSIDTPGRESLRRARGHGEELAARMVRRDGQPEDVARAAVYLASDDAAFVTGSVLVVDGGSLRGMTAHAVGSSG